MSFDEIVASAAAFAEYGPREPSYHIRQAVITLARQLERTNGKFWKLGGLLSDGKAQHLIHLIDFRPDIAPSIIKKLSLPVLKLPELEDEKLNEAIASWVAGAVVIIVLWVAILFTIFKFFRLSIAAGSLLLPYILWVSFAAALNISVWILNP